MHLKPANKQKERSRTLPECFFLLTEVLFSLLDAVATPTGSISPCHCADHLWEYPHEPPKSVLQSPLSLSNLIKLTFQINHLGAISHFPF